MESQENNHVLLVEKPLHESAEACTRRLSKRLSEYEQTCIDTKGKANQLRKERDAERTQNDKLRKELDRLKNQLLRERTKVASLEKEVKQLQDKTEREQEIIEEDGKYEEPIIISHQDQSQSTNTKAQPLDKEAQEILTAKLHELQTAIEDNMDRNVDKKKTEEQFIAMSILMQSLQSYMDVELETKIQNYEMKGPDVVNSADSMTSYENDNYLLASKERTKKDLSVWLKIIVYLGPVFLSLLCYAVFATKK